jgi:hypothetical protein
MADRLEELRRQRALVQQHLEWLDREIAAESGKSTQAQTGAKLAAVVTLSNPANVTAPPGPAESAPQRNPDAADKILDEYRVAPESLQSDVRKGCWIYFAAALAIFFGVVAILYFALSSR